MAKYRISLEVEVEVEDREDAKALRDDMLLSLQDSMISLESSLVISDNIAYVKQFNMVGPDAMTGAQIMTGTLIHSDGEDSLARGPAGYKFQLIKRTQWSKIVRSLPEGPVRDAFLSSVEGVWIHPDHPAYCWTQTRIS